MTALGVYLASHWVLVIITTLSVVGLGVAAYVFKNLKFAAAGIALAVAGFMYQGAVMSGVQLQLQKDMALKVALLQGRIDTSNKLSAEDAARAVIDFNEIERLKGLASETPANSGACLDRDSASRLRNIR